MDKKLIIIIALSLILIGIGGTYAYSEITEKYYNYGVQDAVLLMNQEILNSLNQQGYVPFVFQQDNQTYNIKLGVINEK